MENLEWQHDLERQEAILVLNEICRHHEELQEEFPGEWPAFDELERGDKVIQDLEAGKITQEQAEELLAAINSSLEDRCEAMIEKFREADVVEPVMTRRAGKEAEMKGLSGFSQALAGNAFKWASRGILESDWLDRVFEKYPHSPHESWMREAYERRIDVLRSEGPWPWPRD